MRTIIAGSRQINDYDYLCKCINRCPFKNEITEVISGTANGVDKMGEKWAEENNIPIKKFPADWKKFGLSAGPIRNKQMAENADVVIILMIRNGSSGSKNMYETALKHKLKIYREFYDE